jgi:hypothetical protein
LSDTGISRSSYIKLEVIIYKENFLMLATGLLRHPVKVCAGPGMACLPILAKDIIYRNVLDQ